MHLPYGARRQLRAFFSDPRELARVIWARGAKIVVAGAVLRGVLALAMVVVLVLPPTTAGAAGRAVAQIQPPPPSNPPAPPDVSAPAVTASASLNRDSLDFGSAPVAGTWTAEQSVTVTSTGGVALLIASAELPLQDLAQFSETGGDCPLTPATPWALAPGATCTYAFRFHPTDTGAQTGTFTIHLANASDLQVTLLGTGVGPTATLSEASIDFGTSTVGVPQGPLSVRLSNPTQAPLAIAPVGLDPLQADFHVSVSTDPSDPAPCGPALGPGDQCSLAFVFTPTATGPRSTNATVVTDDATAPRQTISLQGNGIATIVAVTLGAPKAVLSATRLDFGSQAVQTLSGPSSVTVGNTGTAPLTIAPSALPLQPDFSPTLVPPRFRSDPAPCGAVLAPSARCTLSFTFHPSATGARQATFTRNTNDPAGEQQLQLVGTGTFDPRIRMTDRSGRTLADDDSTNPLRLQDEAIGTRSPRVSILVTSSGTTPLHFRGVQLVGSSGKTDDFQIDTQNCPTLLDVNGLAPGKSCTITLSFKPVAPGVRTAVLKIDTDAPSSVDRIDLAANGIGAAYTLSNETLDFGQQGVGSLSPQQTVQLTNSGSLPLALQDVGLDAIPSDFLYVNPLDCPRVPVPLAVGASCTLAFRFLPAFAGAEAAHVIIQTDVPQPPPPVALTGSGTVLQVQPANIVFGQVATGTASLQPLVLKNSGGTQVTLLPPEVDDPADFGFVNRCPAVLDADQSCELDAAFHPVVAEALTSHIRVAAAGTGASTSVALQGEGTSPSRVLTFNKSSLDFGALPVGTKSTQQTILVTNSGQATIHFMTSAVAAQGTDLSSDFKRVDIAGGCPVWPLGLSAGKSCALA